MRRVAADLLAVVHAIGEVALFGIVLFGPLPWATAVVVAVGVPMALLQGACWLTSLERWLRGRRVPSMTRRLLMWCGVGRVVSRRAQWWVLGGTVTWWAARVWIGG